MSALPAPIVAAITKALFLTVIDVGTAEVPIVPG